MPAMPRSSTPTKRRCTNWASASASSARNGRECRDRDRDRRRGDHLYFLAACESMRNIRRQVGMIAGVDVPSFWVRAARARRRRLIRKLSLRADQKFLKVNCAALPDALLESELFGFEAGAFTGATRPKPGRFSSARRGQSFWMRLARCRRLCRPSFSRSCRIINFPDSAAVLSLR